MILANTIEVVPIWKKKKEFILWMPLFIENVFESAPVTIDIDVYEMDGATEVIFHNYLAEKQGLHNTFLRSPQQYIPDDENYIFIYKELTDWAGKRIII
jgi:hypothetical protein